MKKLFENVKVTIINDNKLRVYSNEIKNFDDNKCKLKNVDIIQDQSWLIIKSDIDKEDFLDYIFKTKEDYNNAKVCISEDYFTKKRKNFIVKGTLVRKMAITRYFPICSTIIEYYDNKTNEYFEKS